MSYPNPPEGPNPSSYSQASSTDPFNQPPLSYEGAPPGGPPPPGGPGGPQYQQYYDNESDIGARYEGGGMGRETWASESAWSGNGA
jgi:1,3-beta-glucan synthase